MTTAEQLYKHFLRHSSICTDTRQLKEGDLFFALKGDNFNGNAYAEKAIQQGAAFAVVDQADVVQSDRYLLVEDVLASLQKLAMIHREQKNIPVIAISGSNGKTTTKELLAGVLGSHYKTHATEGNLNNHIGVPLTLLSLQDDMEIAIVEMGANHQGEIAALCAIAQPTHGLLTNVGQAHLEGFGGFEGVKKAKSELYHYLADHNGVVFINMEEPYLADLAAGVIEKIKYRLSDRLHIDSSYIEIQCLALQPQIVISFLDERGKIHQLTTHLAGRHNLQNISTAITVGKYFKVPTQKIINFLASYQPKNNRSQWLKKEGVYFLLDAYNANPSSMKAALYSFSQQKTAQKLAILGDMFELGESAAEHHLAIAEYAQNIGLDNIYLVGKLFKNAASQLKIPHFENLTQLKKSFDFKKWQSARVLIKGSRGMALEALLTDET